MSFSFKSFFKRMLILFVATMLLSPLLSAKNVSQQKRSKKAEQFIPIVMDDIIVMVKIDDNTEVNTGGSATPTTKHLKKTGQTTIYYTHDDGYYEKGVTPNYTRNATTEVVADHVTGLEWQDDVEAKTITKNWTNAQTYCSGLGLDGGGWRLPTVQELQSIVVDGTYSPSIDTTAFVNYATSYYYWSSTTLASYTSSAWVVNFYNGRTYNNDKSNSGYVRCVR